MKNTTIEHCCPDCDEVFYAEINTEDFLNYKSGIFVCPNCGLKIFPCEFCAMDKPNDCKKCPYENAEEVKILTDEEYVEWEKKNAPEEFDLMKSGELGDYWKSLADQIEKDPV